jgi:hypothetical protein
MLMKILSLDILSPMNLYFSLARLILGMETSFFISRPNIFSLLSLVKNVIVFVTILDATLSSATLCIVKKCPPYHVFHKKAQTHPTPLHPIISIGPFPKWGISFMQCKPTSVGGHTYIIVIVDYFTKWAEAMPTFLNDGRTAALFLFNVIFQI